MFLQNLFLGFLAVVCANAQFAEFTAFDGKFDFKEHLTSRSPYHKPYFYGPSIDFPTTCKIKQVHTLQRHGSRNPTGGNAAFDAVGIANFQQRLLNGSVPIDYSVSGNPLSFVPTWTPVIEAANADALSSSGRVELFDMGRQFYERYHELFNASTYNIYTAAQQRVVDSALWYGYGMFGEDVHNFTNYILVSENATAGSNSLSSYNACPASDADDFTTPALEAWRNVYMPPIRQRLNPYFSNYNLTNDDILNLYGICSYEIALQDYSEFCKLFNSVDFLNFEYEGDLSFSYGMGNSVKWGSIFGGAYANSLANSLRSVENNTQQVFFAFTHDANIIPVETALGFFTDNTPENPLPTSYQVHSHSMKASEFVPFAGNLITELFQCEDSKYYVRHLVNEEVFPLSDCGFGPSNTSDGMCELYAYLNSPVRVNGTSNGIQNFDTLCNASAVAAVYPY
ncbi:extracellular acid phosphatase Pho1 [Schizosaccharomyces pombe]|uniref:Acid phosphatase n=1 Tax=Schizosaccharomyces pombe (strain 972 / ATCC 24843) TaxID=284812 RepID=PPA1_SCHPO|nr:acid phosphatase Pho1 [Schizosaccharomyces pombe]P08091.1 RecName: Full=Acid phosphatase; Flags: Precursor [Schizosaccharomyces pombe 972h-]AAA35321.1 acid phosphatase precursor [Schizosaccharomyces pombe]CAB68657.1 acid phosphatase Pho1 [Schizosaccharomyces pombe]|eukprot:NP_596847.1 acid phosphatase Pho1 [Schizosaccharomyces pombe]